MLNIFLLSLLGTKKFETYSTSHPITSQFILKFWYDFWASCMFSFISLRIPGRLNDRRTPLGELNWIFTAITDTIAWNVLPRGLFWQKSSYSTISEVLVSCQSTAQIFQGSHKGDKFILVIQHLLNDFGLVRTQICMLIFLFHKITETVWDVAYEHNMVKWCNHEHSVVALTSMRMILGKAWPSLAFK